LDKGIRVTCVAPGEWLLFSPTEATEFLRQLRSSAPGEHLAAVDVTHGQTLLRLTGPRASDVVSSLGWLDLSPSVFPPGSATYSPVAGVRTGIARDDLSTVSAGFSPGDVSPGDLFPGDVVSGSSDSEADWHPPGGELVLSYLLHCDRSLGRHLHDELRGAGERFGLEIEGFLPYRDRRAAV
jgi:hypothetical protein